MLDKQLCCLQKLLDAMHTLLVPADPAMIAEEAMECVHHTLFDL